MKIFVPFFFALFFFYVQDAGRSNTQNDRPEPVQMPPYVGDTSQFASDTAHARINKEILAAKYYLDSSEIQMALEHLNCLIDDYSQVLANSDTLFSRILLLKSKATLKKGEYDTTEELINRSFDICKEIPKEINPLYPEGLSVLAELYYIKSEYGQSIKSYEKALFYYKLIHGEEHFEIGATYNNLGVVYCGIYDLEKALTYHNKAIRFRKAYTKDNGISLAQSYANKGTVFQYLNLIDSAIHYHSLALEIQKSINGENHARLARIYQNIGTAFGQIGDIKSQLEYFEKAKPYYESKRVHYADRAEYFSNLGMAYKGDNNYLKARQEIRRSLEILKNNGEKRTVSLTGIYQNLAVINIGLGKYKLAKKMSDSALASIPEHLKETYKHLPSIYSSLGVIHSGLGDDELAVSCYEKSLSYSIRKLGKKNADLLYAYHNLAYQYRNQGHYEKAIEYEKLAYESHRLRFSEAHPNVPYFYDGIANCYLELKKFSEARLYFNKSAKIFETLEVRNPKKWSWVYYNLFRVNFEELNYSSALKNLQKAIRLGEEGFPRGHSTLAFRYYWMGLLLQRMENYDDAEKYFTRSLINYGYENDGNFENTNEVHWVVTVLQSLARNYHLKYRNDRSKRYIELASDLLDQAIKGSEYRKDLLSPDAKIATANEFRTSYEQKLENLGLRRLVNTNDPKNVLITFRSMEKSRSQELLDVVFDNKALKYSSVPDSLVEKDYKIRNHTSSIEKQRYKKYNPQDTVYLDLSVKLRELKSNYEGFKSELKSNYPDYYKARYSQQVISVSGVQDSLLGENQALVEYFVGDSSIFTFIILPDTFYVQQIKKDFPLNQWVEDMLHGIYDPYSSTSTEERSMSYAEAAHQIYEKVFYPVETLLPEGTEIILVPDGILGYIPFDALITDSVDSESYLIRDHQISYAYSATLQAEMQHMQHDRRAKNKVLAFAPSFDQQEYEGDTLLLASRFIDVSNSRNWLGPLQYNNDEVLAISELADTDLYMDSLATKDNFLQTAGDYRIVHLSTHGKANDKMGDYSFLAFHDKKDSTESWLYNRELYGLDLNADMVVLSACETGIGELQRGEGIISLARGFSYAGAKSIVTTLWSVNDQSTQKLMELFYGHLKQGMRKDAALRQAKLDYLDKYPNLGSDPYFWAGIIPIGDMSPVALSSSFHWWWIVLPVAGLGLVFFFFSRRKAVT